MLFIPSLWLTPAGEVCQRVSGIGCLSTGSGSDQMVGWFCKIPASQVQQGSPSPISSVNTEHSTCAMKPVILHMLHKATQVHHTLIGCLFPVDLINWIYNLQDIAWSTDTVWSSFEPFHILSHNSKTSMYLLGSYLKEAQIVLNRS